MGVTIIGAGAMARGIGTRLAAAGESLTFINRTPANAEKLAADLRPKAKGDATVKTAPVGGAIKDDIVVLALYYPAEKEVAIAYREQLAGKIVVEITNPLNATYDELATSPGVSAAEEIAWILSDSKVVKAFNTTFAGTLVEGEVGGLPLDVFLAGDDVDAKARLAKMLQAAGLRPLDVGPLKRARQLEGLGLLHITQQAALDTGFASAVKIVS